MLTTVRTQRPAPRAAAVVGGGPGGLYVARLLKLARPDFDVTVYERNGAGSTFGFGVGLTPSTLRNLAAADPESAASIRAAGHTASGVQLRVGSGVLLHEGSSIAIGRAELLAVLRAHAEAAGVRVRAGQQVAPGELDGQVVVAADGVRSAFRESLGTETGTRTEVDRQLFLWCGTDFALPHAVFTAAATPHGVFVVHAYPYAPDRSTVLIETDEATWRAAGLDRLEPGQSADPRSLAYLQGLFAEVLQGRPLLVNQTRWQRFVTVSSERWSIGNTVLLGDAAHTAHYSLGSGTKLAMEDAIALAEAITDQPDDLPAAFASYQVARLPDVLRLQTLARRSQVWWESFPSRMGVPAAQLMTSYMTRGGNITVGQLAAMHPDLVLGAAEAFVGSPLPRRTASSPDALRAAVLEQPLRRGALDTPSRRVAGDLDAWAAASAARKAPPPRVARLDVDGLQAAWGEHGDRLAGRAASMLATGADVLWLTASTGDHDPTARLALTERIRLATGAPVGTDLPADRFEDAVAGLLSGRTDLVRLVQQRSTS